LYATARIATEERKILANMAPPQPATPLFCDNEVAIGIAADTVSQRMSKATDMRRCTGSGTRSAKDAFVSFSSAAVTHHRVLAPFIAADPADDDSTIALNNLSISSILFAASY
jgi:hypothetical protein